MSVIDGAVVALAAATIVLSLRRHRITRRLMPLAGAVATLAAASIAVTAEGRRWQLLPALAAALVAGVTSLLPVPASPTSRPRRIVRAIAHLDGLVLVTLTAVLAWAFPVVRFPVPDGPSAVGTVTIELGTAARPLVVQLWYPADATDRSPRALYLGRSPEEADAVARGMSEGFGVPAFVLAGIADGRTQARTAARMGGYGRRPVVLFSPGSSSVRMQNTAWAADLASHGYVVAGVDHPYDSTVVVLADGRVLETRIQATGDDDVDEAVANRSALDRAADLRTVLDDLAAVDEGTLETPLAGRLDLDRVAVTGHSLGGAAALQAAGVDDRFDAAINIDGYPRNEARPRQPILMIVSGRGSGNEVNDAEYHERIDDVMRGANDASRVTTIPDAAHLTFTDAPLFLPPLPSLIGGLGRTAGLDTTTELTLAFLDETLRDEPPTS